MDAGVLTGRSSAAVLALTAALLAACGPREQVAAPGFRAADCPPRLVAEVLTPVTCGYVEVPERHTDPSGPQVQLFVARVLPNAAVSGEPVLYLGYDVGGTVEYGSIATLAPRIHREVVILDSRGTGFSRPHLGCPEIAAVAPDVVALGSADVRAREAYRTAVRQCHSRLTRGGVDVAAYGLDEIGEDVEDVVRALDLGIVDLFTAGTTSRFLAPVLAGGREKAHRVVVIDTGPVTAAADDRLAVEALPEALDAADALCDAECRTTGRPGEVMADLVDELDRAPLLAATSDGRPVLLDGARLRGIAAWWLERDVAGASLARELTAAAAGRGRDGPMLTAEQVLCLGQRPKCSAPDFAYGVWWTVRCRDQAPGLPAFVVDVCAEFPVGRADRPARAPASAVPVLALHGALNPYVPATERELPDMSRRTVVLVPDEGQDAGLGCIRPWRNRWVDDPSLEPEGLCPGAVPPVVGVRTWDE